jgi:ABC-type multidrug transport system fused ATPase/permease subunit
VINADRIVVLEKGKIVEKGTHSQLLSQEGLYHQLYKTGFTDEWLDDKDALLF